MLLRRRAKKRIPAAQECFKVVSGGTKVASECSEIDGLADCATATQGNLKCEKIPIS